MYIERQLEIKRGKRERKREICCEAALPPPCVRTAPAREEREWERKWGCADSYFSYPPPECRPLGGSLLSAQFKAPALLPEVANQMGVSTQRSTRHRLDDCNLQVCCAPRG